MRLVNTICFFVGVTRELGVWTAVIAALFLFVGGSWLMNTVITGTSTAEATLQVSVPIILAVVGLIVSLRVFS